MGKTAVIIGHGQFPRTPYPLYLISQADYIICCDGALEGFLRRSEKIFGHRRIPDVAIGDMDSMPKGLLRTYPGLVVRQAEQQTNDQTKAFNYVLENFKDVTSVHFVAATGLREDHTIGNISLLMEYSRERDLQGMGISIDMVSDHSTIFPLTDTCSFDCGQGRAVSIFSPDNSLTITSEGLEWQTEGLKFDNWWKATLNRASADTVTLRFSHPSIALVILN